MGKKHFKYAYGYINVDDNNVYFTSTGNWSEIKKLREKGESSFGHIKKIFFWVLILLYLAAALAIFIYSKENNMMLVGIALVTMLIPIMRMVNDDSSDVKFFIPKSKIYEIRIESTVIWLKFYSKDRVPKDFYIQNLEAIDDEFVQLIKSPYTLLKFV